MIPVQILMRSLVRPQEMSHRLPEPLLDSDTIREIRKGVEEFNSGRFFECHDTLEDLWRGIRGPARNFFQGVIQVAVGFYHLGNANLIGAQSQLEKALRNLAPYGDRYAGVELASMRSEVESWLRRIHAGGEMRCTLADLPKLHFTPSAEGP